MVLWGRPKAWIVRNFSSVDLEELRRFRKLEPWGGEWDNLRAGTVATAAASANPYRKSYSIPKPGDWFRRGKAKRQSEKEIRNVVDKAADRFAAWRKKNLAAPNP